MYKPSSIKTTLGLIVISIMAFQIAKVADAQQNSVPIIRTGTFKTVDAYGPAPAVVYETGLSEFDACGCQQCGCLQPSCETCSRCRTGRCRSGNCQLRGRMRAPRRCPECECENCHLEVDESDVEKVCFKTEQKVVCIPKVRMPWQECCPPTTSRSRVVTVLSTHTYKCPSCSYTWTDKWPEPKKAETVAADTKNAAFSGRAEIPFVAQRQPTNTHHSFGDHFAVETPVRPRVEATRPAFEPRPRDFQSVGSESYLGAPISTAGQNLWQNRSPQRFNTLNK